MKHIFILNPAAGNGAAEALIPEIERLAKRHGLDYSIHTTGEREDACRFARAICEQEDGALRFYVAGGDGTLNEVVNGVFGFEQASVACLPFGTGNDFVANFGLEESAFRDLEAQLFAEVQKVDLMKINGKCCVNVCNIGFDAMVVYHVGTLKKWLRLEGHAAYYGSVLYCLFKKLGSRFRIAADGSESPEEEFLLTAICNGHRYGGGFNAAPLAQVQDGMLDLCAVRKVSRFKIAKLVNLYQAGKHLETPELAPYISYTQGKAFRLNSSQEFIACIDGECFFTKQIEAEIVPGALNFCVPAKK